MTKEAILAVHKQDGGILSILFDNDEVWYYHGDDMHPTFNESCIVTIGGVEMIVKDQFTYGTTDGVCSKKNVPVKCYKELDHIQGIVTVVNAGDLPKIARDPSKLWLP